MDELMIYADNAQARGGGDDACAAGAGGELTGGDRR